MIIMKNLLLSLLLFSALICYAQKPALTKGDYEEASAETVKKTQSGTKPLQNAVEVQLFYFNQISRDKVEIVKYIGTWEEITIPSFTVLLH